MIEKMTSHPYRTLAAVTGVALAAFVFWGTMNTTGFCWREGRYLSDDQRFRNSIKSFYLGPGYVQIGDVERKSGDENIKRLLSYDDVTEFLRINPDCCTRGVGDLDRYQRMGHGGVKKPPFLYQFLGFSWSVFAIRNKQFYIDKLGAKKFVTFEGEDWMNACGDRVQPPRNYFVG